jgi:hypothetical protein
MKNMIFTPTEEFSGKMVPIHQISRFLRLRPDFYNMFLQVAKI